MNNDLNRQCNLEDYRQYLALLVRLQLDQRLLGKIDLSGVVQQTMLEASQATQDNERQDPDRFAAWLRQILAHNLADEVRKLKTGKRDLTRERSLELALEQSSNRLQAWLADSQSSPSVRAQRHEQALELSAALAKLPDAQREALVMRYFQDLSLAQIASILDRSQSAVAGLLKRGLQQLRNQLRDRVERMSSRKVATREERVDEAIAAYLNAADAGQAPDPDEFVAMHGDIANDLKSFFANRERFERRIELPRAASSRLLNQERLDAARAKCASSDSSVIQHVSRGIQGPSFGDYELLEELARGGMGVVYKARQISLNRIVALKMILAGPLASNEDVQRFHREAEAAANLDHPGIVPVHDVGVHNGQHYFSMGYVKGCSLAELLGDGPLPSRTAAELLAPVCEAVQYAHEHHVIHRDLKPANILLEYGGQPNDGSEQPNSSVPIVGMETAETSHPQISARPRITDFGLAKRLQQDSELTLTGQLLGTPSYMSPEQATGGSPHLIGPASDIYALGAILYQMVTGRPPFQAETALETLAQVLESDPVPPRLLNRNVVRELEAICMKCLAQKPANRYSSAGELGDDLRRYLQGECIHATGINLLDRVTRALRPSLRQEKFREWGLGLIAFGLVIFFSHVAIQFLEGVWQDALLAYFMPRSVMFAALLIMLARFRRYALLPRNSAERLVWVVWFGYLLALSASNAARYAFGHDQRESYSSFAVLAGFGFLVMGGHVWAGGYVVGLAFLISAPILAVYSDIAPLISGFLWASALLTFGFHYYRLGRAAQAR